MSGRPCSHATYPATRWASSRSTSVRTTERRRVRRSTRRRDTPGRASWSKRALEARLLAPHPDRAWRLFLDSRHGLEACCVLPGRGSEHAPVLAAELRRTVVADGVADRGHVIRRCDEMDAGLLEPELFLVLQRAHRVHLSEVPVELGHAQTDVADQVVESVHPDVVALA